MLPEGAEEIPAGVSVTCDLFLFLQALEPEMLLPLSFVGRGADVLICGDHKQLGPIVRSTFCRDNG